MKRRIFLYNTVAVLTALIALLAVNGLVTRWITDRYLEQGQDWMEDRLAQVQAILTQWEPASDTWDDLDEQLQALELSPPELLSWLQAQAPEAPRWVLRLLLGAAGR